MQDELLWGAAWLYKATNNEHYLNYLGDNGDALGGTTWAITEFGWDVKYAGLQTLVAKVPAFSRFLAHPYLYSFNLVFHFTCVCSS